MAFELDLPLPSAAHRLMLEWLKPADQTRKFVKLYNFGVGGQVINEIVTLHAASLGDPPPGRVAAIEVRIENGRSYYFEYRPAVAGRIVDRNPPEASAVLGTEAEFRPSKTADHPNIMLLQEDADLVIDRGAFATGEDYNEMDTSTSFLSNPFRVEVTNTTADAATLRINYAADLKPDPSLTPWSPSANWQSPDIEVENARSQADAAFRNVRGKATIIR